MNFCFFFFPKIFNSRHGTNNVDVFSRLQESIYYRHYMALSLKSLPFDEFMKLYDMMVPQIYIPEPSVMKQLLDAIEMTEPAVAREVLPRVWSHMIMFEHLEREQLVTKALNMMKTICQAPADSPVNAQNADAAWSYWNYFKVFFYAIETKLQCDS